MAEEEQDIETQFREAMATLDYYKAQLEGMYKQVEMLKLSSSEHRTAVDTLKEYMEMSDGEEILVPIGGDSFIHAKIAQPKKAIVGLGSGVRVEEGSSKGLERLEKRLDRIRTSESQLQTRIQELEMYAAATQEKINRLYSMAEGQ